MGRERPLRLWLQIQVCKLKPDTAATRVCITTSCHCRVFGSLEGAIAHGRFDELRSYYGPESEAILNLDPSVSAAGDNTDLKPAVGPEAIVARAEELFKGKAVHFKLERLNSLRTLQGEPAPCRPRRECHCMHVQITAWSFVSSLFGF